MARGDTPVHLANPASYRPCYIMAMPSPDVPGTVYPAGHRETAFLPQPREASFDQLALPCAAAAALRWLCCLLLPYDGRAACCCPTTVVPLAAAPRSSLARPPITFYCITAESVQGKSGLRSVWSRGHLILARVLGLGVPQRQKASRRSVSAHPSSAR